MSVKLNVTNNESIMVCLYYGKQESRSTKSNQKRNLIKYQHTQKTVLIVLNMYSYLLILYSYILGFCNSKLASMISKVIVDELQEYKLKGRKHSDHNTFIIHINTKTKHLQIVGKSVWKINEKTD